MSHLEPNRECEACDCAASIEDIALALAQLSREPLNSDEARRRCLAIRDALVHAGIYSPAETGRATSTTADSTPPPLRFRLAPTAFHLSPSDVTFFQQLGQDLLAFYKALNRLYQDSVRGTQPAWVADYLDQGKPEALITYSRMNRFRNLLPGIIRPDVIPTADGMVITELDSVPGGIGLTACLTRAYDDQLRLDPSPAASPDRSSLIAGRDGMLQGFAAMLRAQQGEQEGCLAIVVSDEAKEYRPEMEWMAGRLREIGFLAFCVEPRAIQFTEEGLFLQDEAQRRRIGLLYRFFELFDLKNIPKAELMMYAAKKGLVTVTPPYKPALEEKLAFGLFHHPELAAFWEQALPNGLLSRLQRVLPRTWILDPRPVPPSAVIPHLAISGRAVSDFRRLAQTTQKERQLVIKPSGFSELAWGSRGVSIGHDLPQIEWASALEQALQSFPTTPYVLQEFHKGRLFDSAYFDERRDTVVPMSGRARLSPYYFIVGDKAELGGVLATLCPSNKKIIHGMVDAIMAPCAINPDIPTEGEGANGGRHTPHAPMTDPTLSS